jgi:hypothetical protein
MEQIMKSKTLPLAAFVIGSCVFAASVCAQQFVYPAKGQPPEQQKKDEAACHQWAVQQTGFDPTKAAPPAPSPKPPTPATGVTPGAGVRGAMRGAIVGEIAGDAGAGAAAGAAAARAQSRRQNIAQEQQQAAQQQHAQGAQQASYAKARAACLEGRGYTVK